MALAAGRRTRLLEARHGERFRVTHHLDTSGRFVSADDIAPSLGGIKAAAPADAGGEGCPSSCDDGCCGCCMAKMSSGKVKMTLRDALIDEDIEGGWILACQAKADSDEELVVDIDASY